MLNSISEKVKTCNVSIMNDLSQHRKNLLMFVTNSYLFQPELLNCLERLNREYWFTKINIYLQWGPSQTSFNIKDAVLAYLTV